MCPEKTEYLADNENPNANPRLGALGHTVGHKAAHERSDYSEHERYRAQIGRDLVGRSTHALVVRVVVVSPHIAGYKPKQQFTKKFLIKLSAIIKYLPAFRIDPARTSPIIEGLKNSFITLTSFAEI